MAFSGRNTMWPFQPMLAKRFFADDDLLASDLARTQLQLIRRCLLSDCQHILSSLKDQQHQPKFRSQSIGSNALQSCFRLRTSLANLLT